AHKSVLIESSTVFAAMFESEYKWKEKEENKYEIQDFPYKTVQNAIEYCYELINIDKLEEIILLFKFADKYDMKELKDDLVESLALTPLNLVEYSNLFFQNNLEEFLEKCYIYFLHCKSFSIPIKDLELLNVEIKNTFVMKMFSNVPDDKIPEPSDHTTDQEWNNHFS
uniref:BTB domain-containing protein n=1 Tax=Panagrolaimus sp. ES5 TaxID=591445 RepID=A0AC34FYA9_9BILA